MGNKNYWQNTNSEGQTSTDWGNILNTLIGAYGGYQSYKDAKAANKAGKANAGPQPWSQTSWIDQGPIADYNWHGLNSALSLFQQPGMGRVNAQRVGPSISQNSQQLADWATQFAMGDNPLLNAGGDFTQSLLSGQSPNAWMSNTYDWASGGTPNDFVGMMMGMMGNISGGMPWGGGGGGGGFGGGGGGGGGGWNDMGYNSVTNYMENMMRQYLDDPYSNPIYQDLQEMGTRHATDAFNQSLASAGLALEGAGRTSGGAATAQYGQLANQLGTGVQDAQTMALMQMLGMGQNFGNMALQGQMGTDSLNAQGRMNAANNATARSNAASAAAASMYGTNMQGLLGLGNLALGGMGLQGDIMSGIGTDMLGAQMGALGNLNTLQGLPLQNVMDAFGLTNTLDQQRFQAANANANRMQQAGMHNANQAWENLFNYGNAVNMFGSPFYTHNSQGLSPGPGFTPINPWSNAISGGLGAWGAADAITNPQGDRKG